MTLLFLGDVLIFYQELAVNLSFSCCGMFAAGGTCMSIKNYVSTRMIML